MAKMVDGQRLKNAKTGRFNDRRDGTKPRATYSAIGVT